MEAAKIGPDLIFDFGMNDNLENDMVGVKPAASILRLTVACLLRVKTKARV